MRALFTVVLTIGSFFAPMGQAAAQDGYVVSCNNNGYVVRYQSTPPFYLGGGQWCWATDEIRVSFARGDSAVDGFKLDICPAIRSDTVPCACWRNPVPDD